MRKTRKTRQTRQTRSDLILVLFVATGCHVAPSGGSKTIASPQLEHQAILGRMLDKSCTDCHDDTEKQPKMNSSRLPHGTLALRAMLMVSSKRMPPQADDLDDKDRAVLVQELCRAGGGSEVCARLHKLAADAPFIRPPAVLLRTLSDVGTPPSSPPAPPTIADILFERDARPTMQLDPTYVALQALLAWQRCRVGETLDAACVKKVMTPIAVEPPERAR